MSWFKITIEKRLASGLLKPLTFICILLQCSTLLLSPSDRLALFIGVFCAMSAQTASASWFGIIPSEIPETPTVEWQVQKGDSFLVDTTKNIGYLVHLKGGYTSFPVATGQKRVVRYIGRTYNAATPNRHWVSVSQETKGDRITFGKDGTFFRLSYDDEGTSYGIHSHAYVEKMLSDELRYKSMGCIIVSDEVLAIIGETFALNKGSLVVATVDGFPEESVNFVVLRDALFELESNTNS